MIEAEYGLTKDANEREARAFFAAQKRAKIRREAEQRLANQRAEKRAARAEHALADHGKRPRV